MSVGSGGQTAKDPSGWTSDLLKVHYDEVAAAMDRRLAEQVHELDIRLTAQILATERLLSTVQSLAEKAGDKADAAVQEANRLLATSLAEYKVASNDWVRTFREFSSATPTRKEVESMVQVAVIDSNRLRSELADLKLEVRERTSGEVGRHVGIRASFGAIAGTIAAAVSVLTLVTILANILTGR